MVSTESIIKILKKGGVGVLPTDTIYGLVAQAQNKKAVAKIKKLKKRSAGKPFIILISSLKDLTKLKIKINKQTEEILNQIWPGPVSVAFNKKISCRWPKNKLLVDIIKKTGPLVAPSANPEGLPPASNTQEINNYFSNKIDFSLTTKKKINPLPSTLIRIEKNKVEILRVGRGKIPTKFINKIKS